MKHFMLYFALLLPGHLYCQELPRDTIKISGVAINGRWAESQATGYKRTDIDSATMKKYSLASVASMMAENSSVFIKSYGPGGIATPSFRGTGAGNTQVLWNGIKTDHPMLGQSDLSLLPAGMVDDIHIYYGGASMELNSGAAGAIISLGTKPVWKKATGITMNAGAGSFGNYSGLISVNTGSEKFQSVTKAYFKSAENNFRYVNRVSSSTPFTDIRENNQMRQNGFMQELYYQKSANVLSIRLWYQETDRNLPSSLLNEQPGQVEKQSDNSLKALVNYNIKKASSRYSVSGAWFMDRLNYFNRMVSIDSRNYSERWIFKASMTRNIKNLAIFNLGIDEEFNRIISNNYSGGVGRNTGNLTASIRSLFSSSVNSSFLIREILLGNKLLIPDFSAGIQIKTSKTKEYLLKANFSRNSKVPSMNDLYWMPGGNKDLRNEYAYIYEAGYELHDNIFSVIDVKFDLTLYANSLKDMIQWSRGDSTAYWTAANIKSMKTGGIESALSLSYNKDKLSGSFTASSSYTLATQSSDEKFLRNLPKTITNASVRIKYGSLNWHWTSNFSGDRFTTAYMPSYFLSETGAGIQLQKKNSLIVLGFDINNLFGIDYQTVAYFPLPGRTYSFKILIKTQK